MYKRHTGQVSMLDNPEFFGSLPLDPNNRWIKLSKQIPWHEFDLKYLYIHFMRSLYLNKLNPKKYMNHMRTCLVAQVFVSISSKMAQANIRIYTHHHFELLIEEENV